MSRSEHLSDERIQDWLDGRLSTAEAAHVEAHTHACPRCRSEVEAWRALMADLSTLERLSPQPAFRTRVLEAAPRSAHAGASPAEGAARLPLAARVRARIAGMAERAGVPTAWTSGHVPPERLQAFVDGALGRAPAAAVRRHLGACAGCRSEAQRWAALTGALGALSRLAPSPGFADAVMRHVRVVPAQGPARSRALRLADRARVYATVRPRRAWAAAAGFAFTPAVTAALVAYAVFSHPLVTLDSLAAFAWLKGSALVSGVASSIAAGVVEGASLVGAWSAVDAFSPSPGTAGAALLAFCALTLTSVWVVYRNVITSPVQAAHVRR